MTRKSRFRIGIIAATTLVTVGIHYGWLIEPFFGHVHWLHAVHARFCYIPIMIAAAWFGLRGGLYTATAITVLVLPLVKDSLAGSGDFATEASEILFYYAFAVLIGVLIDRENAARRSKEAAQRQVEQTQKLSLAGQIATGVAHEIKNPLASIKGAADILTDDETSAAERTEFKEILQGEIRRIDATVGEFLEFARPRELRLERMNWSNEVKQAARQMENQAQSEGVSLKIDISDDMWISGDCEQLRQMALNLILNALEATPKGGRITVRLARARGSALLEIEDTGAGIDNDAQAHIFEPFYTTRPSGTGLGLAVVKTIVDAHGGVVNVRSGRGEVTSFGVALPLDGANS